MTVIGKLAANGEIEVAPDTCAVTGRPLGGHATSQRIKGTSYFYTYLSDFQFKLTDEKRAEIEAQIPTYTVGIDMADSNGSKTVESIVVSGKTKAVKPLEVEKE